MIYVYLKKKTDGTVYDITNACAKVEWSGTVDEAARQLSFDYLNAPYDPELRLPAIAGGDMIIAYTSKLASASPVFTGLIFGTEKSSQLGTITYTAYDYMRYLVKSSTTHNFKNTTPEAIAGLMCQEMGVTAGDIYATGVNIASMLCESMSYHDVIMAAYTKAYRQTGDKYVMMMSGDGKLNIMKAEWIVSGFTLSDRNNITESDIQESVEDIINRVRIFDDKHTQTGIVEDAESQSVYGVFQTTYTEEEGVDPQTAAKAQLSTKPSQTITINAVGDVSCLAGYFVKLKDGATGLTGKYWIKSDTHTWENGVHQMELELTFDSIMSEVESSEEDEETA